MDVRPFKAGPDFIDAQYLTEAAGRPAPALDSWFLSPKSLRRHFQTWAEGGDLALVEGVMGLFDGKRGEAFGRRSSAEVARLLDLPVVLVLDARKAGPTLAAVALGLKTADRRLTHGGVVLNRVSGGRQAESLGQALRKKAGLRLLGWLPELPGLAVPERHLGRTAPSELRHWREGFEAALPEVVKTMDFKALLSVAGAVQGRAWAGQASGVPGRRPRFKLAVARDAAFHFYYPENLAALERAGADLAFFSPLEDRRLPEGAQGLIVGGGFPEEFGPALEGNGLLRAEVRKALKAGLPVWAECGGLMWLCRHLVDRAGQKHRMVGAAPATARMTQRLRHFGYTTACAAEGAVWPNGGFLIRGHEFHHSTLEGAASEGGGMTWRLDQAGRPSRREGLRFPGGIATYFHAYLPSSPRAVRSFCDACRRWKSPGGQSGRRS
jgi:cobyrinic acid a,c-diamide synthase